MAPIVGTYQHERNENIDEYFKDLGVPYIARKMMGLASPRMEISNEGEKWTIRTVSMMRTIELIFVLGEEYEETLPSGEILKNVTTMDDDSLVTVSYRPDNTKIVRKYDFTNDGVVLIMSSEKSDAVAKRYFKRVP
ncbi:PREDICTED: fatty acid-binding protein 12-like [Polistes dominula]|uniref:Fatty acid-binding protein 12-like n=1 Tax=Polistes dominula TaxID=743375 RepID=A0ABM1IHF9_POLDO|nr:PREDICTED: fatty acid-binding protein 12-like [Polistes dominula]